MTASSENFQELRLKSMWLSFGIVLLCLIAVGSLAPGPSTGGSDKLVHLLSYAVVSAWFSLLVMKKRSLWVILLLLSTYGLFLEYMQGMTSYRLQDMDDAIANGIGVIVGLGFHFSPFRRLLYRIDEGLYRRFQ